MRYVAPSRDAVDPQVFAQQPLSTWQQHADWLHSSTWPSVDELNAQWPRGAGERFVLQTPTLLADGLHYEERIARHGLIATREANWHDLFNAMIWLRYPALKRAINRRQATDIAKLGPKQRSRGQCALTHFDEAGVIVILRDVSLLARWDVHDWHGLFWHCRDAWRDGSAELVPFGHALLEHALTPGKLIVGKALVVTPENGDAQQAIARCADAIADERLLCDPLELRAFPMSGLPGWLAEAEHEDFHLQTPCYQPLRIGRSYPAPLSC